MMKKLSRNLLLTLLATGLTACSSVNVDEVLPDKAVEYKREKEAVRNLELPPDLTSDRINDRMSVPDTLGGASTSYSEYLTDRRLRGVDASARRTAAGSFAIYRALRMLNPSPYMFYLELPGDLRLIGSSPEMLVRLDNGLATSRVLAGTIRRTGDDEHDLAGLFYTGGTTGVSKGVMLTHRSLYLHAMSMLVAFRASDRDVQLHTIALYHVNGWGTPQAVTAETWTEAA